MSRWVRAGAEPAFAALLAELARTVFPGPPRGYATLVGPRPMRAVLQGAWLLPEIGGEAVPVVVKWHRPLTWTDRMGRRLRGGRGPREGQILAHLAARGVAVPEALAYGDEGPDVLVTRRLVDLRPLPSAAAAPRALLERVAAFLAQLEAAGLVHRDLTAANLGLAGESPVLLDLGGACLRRRTRRRRLAHLVQAVHGLLHGASRASHARALKAWLAATGESPEVWRREALDVEGALRKRQRVHRRRRERTLRTPGRRFEPFEHGARGHVVYGLRHPELAPRAWEQTVGEWLLSPPAGARALAGSARVWKVSLPPHPQAVVLKRYAPVHGGRVPRALRALARAAALDERGLPVARPLLAAAGPQGTSLLVSEALDAPTLHALFEPEGAARGWPAQRRRRCLEALGASLRRLHEADVAHRDLKPLNVLVRAREDGGFDFPLVDLEGARLRYRAVGWRRRARDLARLAASLALPRAARLRVLGAYHRVAPTPPLSLRALASLVHRHAEVQRRRLRTRYGPTPSP